MSEYWDSTCESASVHLLHTGTHSYNSLSAGESYHNMLRRIYNKVSIDHLSMPDQVRLVLSVKAMNDNSGPKGLVPSLLVLGVIVGLLTHASGAHCAP